MRHGSLRDITVEMSNALYPGWIPDAPKSYVYLSTRILEKCCANEWFALIAIHLFPVCAVVPQGVRDLLKAVLDKIQTIPTTVSSAVVQQLLVAREVLHIPTSRCLLQKSLCLGLDGTEVSFTNALFNQNKI